MWIHRGERLARVHYTIGWMPKSSGGAYHFGEQEACWENASLGSPRWHVKHFAVGPSAGAEPTDHQPRLKLPVRDSILDRWGASWGLSAAYLASSVKRFLLPLTIPVAQFTALAPRAGC